VEMHSRKFILFREGDEIALTPSAGPGVIGWVDLVSGSTI